MRIRKGPKKEKKISPTPGFKPQVSTIGKTFDLDVT